MVVRVRKGIHRKPYQVRYRDAQGKRRSKQFRLKKEAEAWNLKVGAELQDGMHVPESQSVTIAEAGSLWITSMEAADPPLQRITIQYYMQHLKLHISPFIGWALLSNFTLPMLTAFDDRLREEGRSSLMRRKVMTSLGVLISNAQQRGLVARNIVRDRKRSFRNRNERPKRLKMGEDIPLPSEITAMLAAASGKWRPLLMTLVFTGLRASELRGLRWQDVDLDARMLHVRQRADPWGKMDHPKSEAGERSIPLSRHVVNGLREWKLACPKSELDLVFPSRKGGPLDHANIITRGLEPTLMKAGICVMENGVMRAKYKGLHCFRHFYASWCLNRQQDGGLGLPYKTVQSRLGHSTLAMTVDTYGHLFPEQEDHAVLDAGELRLLGG